MRNDVENILHVVCAGTLYHIDSRISIPFKHRPG
jgi:hypothetical protein